MTHLFPGACRSACRLAGARILVLGAVAATLGACTFTPWSDPFTSADNVPVAPPQAAVSAGFYRVNPGDTLPGIANAFGQRPDDLARWNGLAGNAPVSPGQVLRVAPPPGDNDGAVVTPVPTTNFSSQAAPLTMAPLQGGPTAPAGNTATTFAPGGAPGLIWPLHGQILKPFVAGQTKGVVIGAQPGETVHAAAAGRVVYSGNGIAAYGPLVIVKHDGGLITAYGQNSKLLVKEGDMVSQGQPIGQAGTDARGVASIQFEVRKDGRPVDPLTMLPRNGG